MKRSIRLSMLASALLLQALVVTKAFAVSPHITAEAVCADGVSTINYVSFSDRSNPEIHIYLNGSHVATGEYASPDFSFSGSVAAPTGETATLAAIAVGIWTDSGREGGQSESITIDLPSDCATVGQGRFTGGGHQIRVDNVRVTRGLTIHCDLLLSNNLEINWQGNQFHMTEHMTTVSCTDDPLIVQAPPAAPLDTLVGVGTGRYNGMDGYIIEFTLVDGGEPGAGVDQAALYVYEAANPANVVLDIPLQYTTGGNLQAHYDQPHR